LEDFFLPALFQIEITPSTFQEGHGHLMNYNCLGDHFVLLTDGSICQKLGHPTVQGIVDGFMNLYSCVAGMLLDRLLGYLTF
jgi:hypothetical protein